VAGFGVSSHGCCAMLKLQTGAADLVRQPRHWRVQLRSLPLPRRDAPSQPSCSARSCSSMSRSS
jgi:hypothetical protein